MGFRVDYFLYIDYFEKGRAIRGSMRGDMVALESCHVPVKSPKALPAHRVKLELSSTKYKATADLSGVLEEGQPEPTDGTLIGRSRIKVFASRQVPLEP